MPISEKWFCEEEVPGKRFKKVKHCFSINKLIFKGKTSFQKALIFKNAVYGRIFCLDNIVEFSEKDEFIYHEMIIHPILFSHKNPENILVIGGGDGGALREILKHPIKRVDLVEIDKEVIKISKKYLKFCCKNSFSDKRVNIYNVSGEEFIKKYKDFYDVVVIDCTNPEPEGISFPLYSIKFYKQVFSALKKDGITITLGSSFLDFENITKKIFKKINKIFPFTSLYKFCMPSYNCGQYSFIAGSKKINLEKVDFKKIGKRFKKISKKHSFKYYSPETHQSSMVFPKIWKMNYFSPKR